jgi:hypothetical protein
LGDEYRPQLSVNKQNFGAILGCCGRFHSKSSSILFNFLAESLISVPRIRKSELCKASFVCGVVRIPS